MKPVEWHIAVLLHVSVNCWKCHQNSHSYSSTQQRETTPLLSFCPQIFLWSRIPSKTEAFFSLFPEWKTFPVMLLSKAFAGVSVQLYLCSGCNISDHKIQVCKNVRTYISVTDSSLSWGPILLDGRTGNKSVPGKLSPLRVFLLPSHLCPGDLAGDW